jgi:opacity protein-like surface antigen
MIAASLVLACCFTYTNALEVKPYISDKVSFGKLSVKDSSIQFGMGSTVSGKDTKDNILGNRLAVGASVPVESIKGAVRAEFEWGIDAKAKVKSDMVANPGIGTEGEFTINTFLINAYYDFNTGTPITPYAGLGAGFAHINAKVASYGIATNAVAGDSSDNVLVYNIGAGAAYAINDNISIDLGYRYTNLAKPEIRGANDDTVANVKSKLFSHEVLLGVRYTF